MKIAIKLSRGEMNICLMAVQKAIEGWLQHLPANRNQLVSVKAIESILRKVGTKFEISAFSTVQQEYSRSFDYHEAFALSKALESLPLTDSGFDIERNSVINKLEKHL